MYDADNTTRRDVLVGGLARGKITFFSIRSTSRFIPITFYLDSSALSIESGEIIVCVLSFFVYLVMLIDDTV